MPWRWGWPPWESGQVRADRMHALEQVERATLDLSDTRRRVARTDRVVGQLNARRGRNHFSESMEELFSSRPASSQGRQGPQQQGG